MRAKFVRVGLALSTVALLATVSSASAGTTTKAAGTYNVGIVVSLTGNGNASGGPVSAAAQTVFKYVNSKGGIKGHKIAWSIYDDQSSVTTAPAVAQQALSNSPVAIVDGTISTYYNLRQPIYDSAKIPVFTDSGIVGLFSWRYSDFPTVAQNALGYVNMTSGLFHGSLKGKRVGMAAANTPGVRAQVPIIDELLKQRNASLVSVEYQTVGGPSFTAGAANIIAAKPDIVYIDDTDADGIVEAKALRDAGYKGPFLSNYGASSIQTMQTINDPLYYGQQLTKPVQPGSLAYTLAKKYGTTQYTDQLRFGQGWVLAYTLVLGLQKCSYPCSPSALQKAVDSLGKYDVPGGVTWAKLSVSPTVHNVTDTYGLYTWDPKKKKLVQQPFKFKMGVPNY